MPMSAAARVATQPTRARRSPTVSRASPSSARDRRPQDAALRIAYVTAGTIGLGHVVPAEAVRRGLRRSGNQAGFQVFGPPSDFASARLPHFTPIEIDAEEVTD